MKINEMVKEAFNNAVSKGWHEEKRTFGELIALCHSELSEALEEYRSGKKPDEIYRNPASLCVADSVGKPEGIPIELADVVIRIFDMCGLYGIDLEAAIKLKMEYNASRPHRHGGKVI